MKPYSIIFHLILSELVNTLKIMHSIFRLAFIGFMHLSILLILFMSFVKTAAEKDFLASLVILLLPCDDFRFYKLVKLNKF